MTITSRVAQAGDIFLLLVPPAQELQHLQQWQAKLQARYHGQPVDFIHVTCQRFTPRNHKVEKVCIDLLKVDLRNLPAFTLYTDRLIQFYAPYWQHYVLRWRVQETDEYAAFRDRLDQALIKIGCPSHFNRRRHATCTALNLKEKIELDENSSPIDPPRPLFTVRELVISKLQDTRQFRILGTIPLE